MGFVCVVSTIHQSIPEPGVQPLHVLTQIVFGMPALEGANVSNCSSGFMEDVVFLQLVIKTKYGTVNNAFVHTALWKLVDFVKR